MRRRRSPSAVSGDGAPHRAVSGESIRQLVLQRYAGLGHKQQKVAKYLLDHQDFASFASVHDIAKETQVDVSTVVRLAQNLGLPGYPPLRQEIRQDYLRRLKPPERLREVPRTRQDLMRAAIQQDLNNLHQLPDLIQPDQIAAAGRILVNARRILIVATGTHAIPGTALAHLGEAIGLPVDIEIHLGPNLSPRLAALGPQDLLVGMGFWRVAREVVLAVRWARSRGVPTLILTDSIFSPLATGARLVLTTPTDSLSFYQSMVAPLTVVYAILAWVMAHDPVRAKRRLGIVQAIHEQFATHWEIPENESKTRRERT